MSENSEKRFSSCSWRCKDILSTIILDKEEQQIVTFESLEPGNVLQHKFFSQFMFHQLVFDLLFIFC